MNLKMLSNVRTNKLRDSVFVVSLALGLSFGMSACSSAANPETLETPGSSVVENDGANSDIELIGAFAKASDSMTGVFGEIFNHSKDDLQITDVSSSVAEMTEMHETVLSDGNMMMKEIEGGFSVPAGGSLVLEPGANHIMLMGLNRELLPGEQIDLKIVFSNQTELNVMVDVRDFAGAIEEYAPGDHDDHMKAHTDDTSHE